MKIKKFILPLITVIILVATFIAMQRNYTDRFNEMDERYKDAIAVNLNGEVSEKSLTEILERNGYVENLTEAQFLSKVLCEKFRGDTLPGAITDLNKRRFHISATRIEAEGTPSIRKKLENSRIQLGQTESIDSLYQTGNLPNVVNVAEGGLGTMKVVVNRNRPEAEISWSDKLLRNTTIPVAGIIVQLEKHVVDSTNTVTSTPIAYAMTDHEVPPCSQIWTEKPPIPYYPSKKVTNSGHRKVQQEVHWLKTTTIHQQHMDLPCNHTLFAYLQHKHCSE